MACGSIIILFIGFYSSVSSVRPGDNNGSSNRPVRRRNHLITVEDPREPGSPSMEAPGQDNPPHDGQDYRPNDVASLYRIVFDAALPFCAGIASGHLGDRLVTLTRGTVSHQGKVYGLAAGVAGTVANLIIHAILRHYIAQPTLVTSIIHELRNARIPLPANVREVTTTFVNRVIAAANQPMQQDNEHD